MAKSHSAESFDNMISKVLEKSNDNVMKLIDKLMDRSNESLEKIIILSNNNLEKLFDKFDSNVTKLIEKSNENVRKSLAHSENILSKLFESTVIRMEALGNSFERAVKSMSEAVTESMGQLLTTVAALSTSVSECQKQVLKMNETPLIESMTRALWAVDQERKDEERRASNVIISGMDMQPGINDKDAVSTLCENYLTLKPQIVKTRRINNKKPSRPFVNARNDVLQDQIRYPAACSPFVPRNMNRTLRMSLANVRSLQNKKNDLNLFLSEYDPDIFSVIETWLSPEDRDELILPPGFCFVRKDRGTRGGGVAFVIKSSVHYKVVKTPTKYSHIEIISIDVFSSSTTYRFISYYRSGGFDNLAVDYAIDSTQCIRELCNGNVNCLLGYFNLPLIDWNNYSSPDNAIYNCFIELFNDLGLHQLLMKIESVQRRFTKAIPSIRHLPYLSRLNSVGLQTIVKIWNALPEEVFSSPSYAIFKTKLLTVDLRNFLQIK
ncbi:hypothetical protein HELRODRAFT_182809 [Helobdella robusta]|uniref:Endonuclease/exonuclease/phosphatase domain-containing protein n=1 Tax=Helobdella robusta TaxID=6412 RepID=T1FIS5_HELRO|nr:hypothetical protein HELRODRAFT_182809 [Helobdella robusta]ESN90115.1 hypothetical protein HELRODRAFT_182809 [Helobdella robusta]